MSVTTQRMLTNIVVPQLLEGSYETFGKVYVNGYKYKCGGLI